MAKKYAPLAASVLSLTLMDANGDIIRCSPMENRELFRLAIGGYGLFGIILEAKLRIVDNSTLKFTRYSMKSPEYLEYFKKIRERRARCSACIRSP